MTDAIGTAARRPLDRPRPAGRERGADHDPLIDPAYYRNVVWRRLFAHLIDTALVALVMAPVLIAMLLTAVVTLGLIAIPMVVAFTFVRAVYYIIYTGGAKSATPGMRLLGIELRGIDGRRPGYLQSALRTLLYYALLGVLTPLVLIVIPLNRQRRGLHDFLSGTVVVNRLEVAIVKA
jgi:uncharacterized RDD family membrane protein YckC